MKTSCKIKSYKIHHKILFFIIILLSLCIVIILLYFHLLLERISGIHIAVYEIFEFYIIFLSIRGEKTPAIFRDVIPVI